MQTIKEYVDNLGRVIARVPLDEVQAITDEIRKAWAEGRTVFLLGNGGSAATASHLACDLAKGTAGPDRLRLRCIALTDSLPIITAWANDASYEVVFSEQLANFVEPGDIVVGISGSGQSPNVLAAMRLARERGARTIGLTGYEGGKLKDLVDRCLIVPSNSMQQIEDVHLVIGHAIFVQLRDGPAPSLS